MRVLGFVSMAVWLIPALAAAQNSAAPEWPLDSGAKVRIFASSFGRYPKVGALVSTTADRIFVRPAKDSAFSIATPDIIALEIARGTHTSVGKGALLGLFFGILGGAAIGAGTHSPSNCTDCVDLGPGVDAAGAGILGGLIGLFTGMAIGSRKTDNWIPVTIPAR
jgi:hypothetical protein